MSSELRVDKIVPTNGVPTGGGGGIIQVVFASKTDTAVQTSVGSPGSWSLEGTLDATITPKFSTSKILITMSHSCGMNQGAGITVRLCRKIGSGSENNTFAAGDSSSNRTTVTSCSELENAHNIATIPINFLDSPSTTDACKYYIRMEHMSGGTQDLYLNRSQIDSNDASYPRSISTITLMEVSA
tara:strand:+ start:162 stop:716 length:555 start_codon:yes stop_codon:yes gene_type:complete